MPHPADWQAFEALLSADQPHTETLNQLLQAERESLQQRDYARFEQIIGEKHRLLDTLQEGARRRSDWLTAQGLDDAAGLALATEEAPGVALHWRSLAAEWQCCQRENRVNEQVARRTRQVVGQVLDILRGTNGERLYDAGGQARRVSSGQHISDA